MTGSVQSKRKPVVKRRRRIDVNAAHRAERDEPGTDPAATITPPTPLARRTPFYGTPPCPTNAAHGPLVDLSGSDRYYCPHSDHDGVSAHHRGGPVASTTAFFRRDEVTW